MDGRLSSLSVHKSINVRKLVSSEFAGKEDKGSRAHTSAYQRVPARSRKREHAILSPYIYNPLFFLAPSCY